MGQDSLVDAAIEDGKALIDRLTEDGIPVTAAFWLKDSEGGPWFLYLVTPLVPEDGATRSAYHRVNTIYRRMPQPFWVEPLEIKVIGESDPIAQDALAIVRHGSGRRAGPIRWVGSHLGGLSLEGAYFYPLAVPNAP